MFWIIASLVLAFMLAPILWIVPSPRQRRQMRLRERARELGITVQIATFPQTRRQRVRKEEEYQGLAYCMALPRARAAERWRFWLDAAAREGEEFTPPAAIAAAMQRVAGELPNDCRVVEAGGRMLRVWWREANAEVATVEALADLMNRMIDEDFADEQ